MELIYFPNPILTTPSVDVDLFKNKLNTDVLAIEMLETMKQKGGIGLSAPQIGKNINMFVYNFNDGDQVFYNPTIIEFSREKLNVKKDV